MKGGEMKSHSPPRRYTFLTSPYERRLDSASQCSIVLSGCARSCFCLSIIRKRNYYGQTFCSRICPLGPKTTIELGGVTLTV